MRVVDAHQHFWSKEVLRILNFPPEMGLLNRDYGPGDLRPQLDIVGVSQTILVQTYSSYENTNCFLELAEAIDWVAGVVGWVDLTDPHLSKVLDVLQSHPKFKGVRHQWHDEPDHDWLIRGDVIRGLRELERRHIPYELLVKPFNCEYIPRVIEAVPNLDLVIDHLGKPSIKTGQIDDWTASMSIVADHPNLYCKLSGMVTEADWQCWKPSDLRPYVEKSIELFGVNRLMFGSDWPVCLLAGSYTDVFDALQECLKDLSEGDKAMVMGGTACRFYRLV